MKRPCAICGKRQDPEEMVFSRWTGNRYCGDVDACKRRAKRKKSTAREAMVA